VAVEPTVEVVAPVPVELDAAPVTAVALEGLAVEPFEPTALVPAAPVLEVSVPFDPLAEPATVAVDPLELVAPIAARVSPVVELLEDVPLPEPEQPETTIATAQQQMTLFMKPSIG
jgi:hypothetical protein